MAFVPRRNLTASSGTTVGPINIPIANVIVTNRTTDKELTIDLYIYNNTTAVTVYVVKAADIPIGSSLQLDVSGFSVNTRPNQDNVVLKVTMDSSISSLTTVADVIIGKNKI